MRNQIFHFSNSGISSGQRFYLKDDVSGIFVRNLNIDSNFPVVASNLVYNTGDQTISGNKTFLDNINVSGSGIFNALDLNNIDTLSLSGVDISITNGNVVLTNRPTVNGTGVLLSGEASAITLPTTIVYITGDQIISGNKTFISGVTFSGENVNIIDANLNLLGVGDMTFSGTNINFINSPVYISGTNLRVDGNILANNLVYNTGDQNISGAKNFYTRPTVNGTGVLLQGELYPNITFEDLVLTTGNQNISGIKNFYTRPTVNSTGVLLIGEAANAVLPTTLVYITGDQTISGIKTFENSIIANTISGKRTGIFFGDRFNLNLEAMDNVYSPAPFVSGGGGIKIVGGSGSFFGGPVSLYGGRGPNGIYDGAIDIRASSIDFNISDTSNIGKSVTVFKTGSVENLTITENYINVNNQITVSGNVNLSSGTLTASNIVYNTGNQIISGIKTFANNLQVQETGIFNALDLSNISSFDFSGTNINLISGNVNISGQIYISGNQVLTGIDLKNYYPDLLNFSNNFYITGTQNNKMILANSSTTISGIIVSGNATGFNTSIIQIGAGQIQITGSGIGIQINSYNNQYRTAGQFATISILHTGNNRYIMYGNTAL